MQLINLVLDDKLSQMEITGSKNVNILGLTADSRAVQPGFLFAALQGTNTVGLNFVQEAIERGAVAVLAEAGTQRDKILSLKKLTSLITCENSRLAYAHLSARFFENQPKTIAAITGTNGKSSVAEFVRQLWSLSGVPAASLGTLGLMTPKDCYPTNLTTPDAALLHEHLNKLTQDNIDHLTLEASSHGLAQNRLDGVQISIAAFTNLSRDHLDYHITFDNYFSAKVRLFSEILASNGVAVLNKGDKSFEVLSAAAIAGGAKVLSYGWEGKDIRLLDIRPEASGQRVKMLIGGVKRSVKLPLVGGFHALNVRCALGIILASGGDSEKTIEDLEKLMGVRGRAELATRLSNGAAVYVDYAHTPDALRQLLISMRPHTDKNLNLVFGCGGDRDSGKRAQMGAIACSFADNVIITDDNPRTEDAALIRNQVLKACKNATEIGDREEAIFEAVSGLKAGDLLIIAGKGHELKQVIGAENLPFNDVEVAVKAVLNLNLREVNT